MQKKEKKYSLLKAIIGVVLVLIVLSWLIPAGEITSSGYVQHNMIRYGLNDIPRMLYSGIEFGLPSYVFLLAIGVFYGVLSSTKGYKRLVEIIAKKLSAHKKVTLVVTSILIALLTSMVTQTFAVLIFIPFIISVLKRMNIDKMTILMTTFGSIIVGIMGALYGTQNLLDFIGNFANDDLEETRALLGNTVLIRMGILAIGLVLFNFLTLNHFNKTKSEESSEMYEIVVDEESKKESIVPVVIIGILILILVILGYVDWEANFNIQVFNNFHDFIDTLVIQTSGEEFNIINSILGSSTLALGTWTEFEISTVLLVASGILAICYRMKFNDLVKNIGRGIKVMILPMAVIFGAYVIMNVPNAVQYPYTATIFNFVLTLAKGFNVATFTLVSLIANFLITYVPYTNYLMGSYLATQYATFNNQMIVILNSTYGLVQFFAPTSIILGIGLVSMKVKYIDWLKNIWKFIVGMLICLVIIFVLITIL